MSCLMSVVSVRSRRDGKSKHRPTVKDLESSGKPHTPPPSLIGDHTSPNKLQDARTGISAVFQDLQLQKRRKLK